uniref:Uncharacterized protein n=1 Tax=Strigamia maritima TaxID=126957 RepID=T1JGX0_STRMM
MAAVDSAWRLFDEFLKAVQPYQNVITILGILYGSKIAIKSTWNLYKGIKTFVWPLIAPESDFIKTYGSWAVITGSTDGIGKEYARELARRKMNVILISRNEEKLEKIAHEIENEFKVETLVIQADFSNGKEIYPLIARNLIDKEIGILVNNVGVMITPPSEFMSLTEKQIWDYINVNMAAATLMTHLILPQMLTRHKGAIVNISSSSAINPLPLLGVYSATKIFVEYLSQSLAFEYRRKGITVQTLVPCYVATKMVGYSKLLFGGYICPSPAKFVQSALRTLGRSDHTTGYWTHGIQYLIYSSVSKWLFGCIGAGLHQFLARH